MKNGDAVERDPYRVLSTIRAQLATTHRFFRLARIRRPAYILHDAWTR
jgi:hypothetical protein